MLETLISQQKESANEILAEKEKFLKEREQLKSKEANRINMMGMIETGLRLLSMYWQPTQPRLFVPTGLGRGAMRTNLPPILKR